jgi:Flp pilus assembly protein protease CpaA
MCLCTWGALVTARRGVESKPMLFSTVGFVVMMIGSIISIIGDGLARYLAVGPDFEDVFYLLTNMWTVAGVVGLLLIVIGLQLSYRPKKKKRRRR